jgi:DNA-binding transcriptional MerR regulator
MHSTRAVLISPENTDFGTPNSAYPLDLESTQRCRLSNMDTLQVSLTIQEAAEVTHLSVHTLRYYERIGLLLPVGRAANGHRRYSQQDINLIKSLNKWRQTGMPLVDIQRYVKLIQEGETTAGERRAILEAHRKTVVSQIEELQATLELIDYKIQNYTDIEQRQEKTFA